MNAEQIPDAVTQINSTLKETLDFIKQAGGATLDFSKEQVPLYIQELLNYNFVMSLSGFITGLIVLLIILPLCLYWIFCLFKKQNLVGRDKDELSPIAIIPGFMSVISLVIGIAVIFNHLDWVKIKFAPRVYTVEKIQEMLK